MLKIERQIQQRNQILFDGPRGGMRNDGNKRILVQPFVTDSFTCPKPDTAMAEQVLSEEATETRL